MRFPFGWRRNRAREEALAWLARLNRGLRETEGPELLRWLHRPRHRRTIARAAADWHGPEVLAVLSEIFPIDPKVLEPRRSRSHLYILAGMILFCAVYLIPRAIRDISFYSRGNLVDAMGDVYTTGPGTTRQVLLKDGSRLRLNAGTRVTVFYAEHLRNVYVANGEVTFTVTRAAYRPFHVHAGGRDFEGEAATYDVRVPSPDQMDLTVIAGAVTVFPAPRIAPSAAARRDALEVYVIDPVLVEPLQVLESQRGAQTTRTLTQQDLRARLAWQGSL